MTLTLFGETNVNFNQ